jgi:hypothetical protein
VSVVHVSHQQRGDVDASPRDAPHTTPVRVYTTSCCRRIPFLCANVRFTKGCVGRTVAENARLAKHPPGRRKTSGWAVRLCLCGGTHPCQTRGEILPVPGVHGGGQLGLGPIGYPDTLPVIPVERWRDASATQPSSLSRRYTAPGGLNPPTAPACRTSTRGRSAGKT